MHLETAHKYGHVGIVAPLQTPEWCLTESTFLVLVLELHCRSYSHE